MSSSSQAHHANPHPSPEAQDEEIRMREIETVYNFVAGYIHEFPSSSLDYILGPPQLNFNGQTEQIKKFLRDLIWVFLETCRDRLSGLLVAIVRRGAPDNAIITDTVRILNTVLFRTHEHIGRNVPESWIPYCSFVGKFIHDDSMFEGGPFFPRTPVIGILSDVFESTNLLNTCGRDIWTIKRQRITTKVQDNWITGLRGFEYDVSQALEYRHLAGMAAGLLDTARKEREAAKDAKNRAG
ncbi:hypothetical protein GGR55DRAFT_677085 [Xylaria sp. FL0064]|nr:hypothetical protein GGR55DRAFT_677085 [Xylaria sp. FL0064]